MTQNDDFKRQFWVSVSVVIVTMLISSVALYFLATNMQETAHAIGAARSLTANENAEFQDLANLRRDSTLAASYQTVMDKLLASQEALITFPTQIDALGRADSVSTSFAFQGTPIPAASSTPGSVGFALEVSGSITNVLSFMKDFETNAPILLSSLDTVSLAASNSSYTLTAEGRTFFK